MSSSLQTLMDEFKKFVSEKFEVEYQHNSSLIKLLPQLVNQDSKSDVKDQLLDT